MKNVGLHFIYKTHHTGYDQDRHVRLEHLPHAEVRVHHVSDRAQSQMSLTGREASPAQSLAQSLLSLEKYSGSIVAVIAIAMIAIAEVVVRQQQLPLLLLLLLVLLLLLLMLQSSLLLLLLLLL